MTSYQKIVSIHQTPRKPVERPNSNLVVATQPVTHTGKKPVRNLLPLENINCESSMINYGGVSISKPAKPIHQALPATHRPQPVPKNIHERARLERHNIEMREKQELQNQVNQLAALAGIDLAHVDTDARPTIQFLKPNPGIRPVDGSSDVAMMKHSHFAHELQKWADEPTHTNTEMAARADKYNKNYSTHATNNQGVCGRCRLSGFDTQQFACNQIKPVAPVYPPTARQPLSKNLPAQLSDGKPVNPQKPSGPTWGQVFGRKSLSVKPAIVTAVALSDSYKQLHREGVFNNLPKDPDHPINKAALGILQNAMAVTTLPKEIIADARAVMHLNCPAGTEKQQRELWLKQREQVISQPGIVKTPLPQMMRPKRITSSAVAGCNLVINAGAGTGKTSTMEEGVNRIHGRTVLKHQASDEQEAIWQAMVSGEKPKSIMMVAFNKSIATHLDNLMVEMKPLGVEAKTIHSFGSQMIRKAGLGGKQPTDRKTRYMMEDIMPPDLLEKHPLMCWTMQRVVTLIKSQLLDWTFKTESADEVYYRLCERFDIGMDDDWDEYVIEYLPKIMAASQDKAHLMDFTDMLWLPNVRDDIRIDRRDLVIVDEAQDMNPAQQGLIEKCARRIILCGDRNQAIYGFTGADVRAIDSFVDKLKITDLGCMELPLSITRRCPIKGVELANRIVPSLKAAPGAIEGEVIKRTEEEGLGFVEPNDLVLCRTNAPIVVQCLRMLKSGRKARIQGRDIGDDLIQVIKGMKADDIPDLCDKLQIHLHRETEKAQKRKFGSENAIAVLQDKTDCIISFTSGMNSIDGVIARIQMLFDDRNTEGTLFSSIHRAKGLEADNVVFLQHDKCPSPIARQEWQVQQEWNLWYVAVTRFKQKLYMVQSAKKQSLDPEEC